MYHLQGPTRREPKRRRVMQVGAGEYFTEGRLSTSHRTRTNTNPNDTEANAAGRSVRACVARKSKS